MCALHAYLRLKSSFSAFKQVLPSFSVTNRKNKKNKKNKKNTKTVYSYLFSAGIGIESYSESPPLQSTTLQHMPRL